MLSNKQLEKKKARAKIGFGAPSMPEGKDGDIQVCYVNGQKRIYAKYSGQWYYTKVRQSDFELKEDTTPELGGDLDCNNNDVTNVNNLEVDGDLTVNGDTEVEDLTVNGTFDAEYPGKILGYSKYSNTTDAVGYETITVGASWTQLQTANGNNVRTTFNIPTSDKVEITFNAYVRSTNDALYLGLSESSATYVPVGDEYEYDVTSYGVYYADESDKNYITVKWVVDGFTTMSETYYIWAKGQGTIYINHGLSYRTTDYYPPILVKTIELPDMIISET